jgi:hypothetical protein
MDWDLIRKTYCGESGMFGPLFHQFAHFALDGFEQRMTFDCLALQRISVEVVGPVQVFVFVV